MEIPKKAIILGCPGAGKSTFARKLSSVTGIELFYLDMLWHKPDRTYVTRGEFDAGVRRILTGKSWIIDGNYSRTIPLRIQYCDTVYLLDIPLDECIKGAAARVGKKREDLPWVEESFEDEFRQYIVDFHREQLPGIYGHIKSCHDKNVIIFKSRDEADEYLKELKKRFA